MADNFIVTYKGNVDEVMTRLNSRLSGPMLAAMLGTTVSRYLKERAAARFAGEGDDAVGQWMPLKEATIQIRRDLGFGAGPINDRTGELRRWVMSGSLTSPTPEGATLAFPGNVPDGELKKKVFHAQKGGFSDAGKPFPARPVLGVGVSDLTAVVTMLSIYLDAS